MLNDLIISEITNYLDSNIVINKINFSFFVIFIFLIFIFVWIPFMTNLKNNILRTKGMLNMIPMELILNNERLRNTFKTGGILKMVK